MAAISGNNCNNIKDPDLHHSNDILDQLESVFIDDDTVDIRRNGNTITFSQYFLNNLHADGIMPERSKRLFEHTITLMDGKYKAIDKISSEKIGFKGFNMGYIKGEIYEKGFFYGLGSDNIAGGKGLIRQEWSTEYIKAPLRQILESSGLERTRPFWTGRRIAIFFACIWIPIIIAALIILLSR